MEEKLQRKKIGATSKVIMSLIITNVIIVALFIILTYVLDEMLYINIFLLRGIIFALVGITLNFFLGKYLFSKKYAIVDDAKNVKKKLFISAICILVIFSIYAIVNTNFKKASSVIYSFPTMNISSETKTMLQSKSKYTVIFYPGNWINFR